MYRINCSGRGERISQGGQVHNRVILGTGEDARAFLEARMDVRPIEAGQVLYEEGEAFGEAIFPHLGVISIVAEMPDGRSVEKASIGNEGFVGFTYLMGGAGAVGKAVVQIPGYASFISFADLEVAMAEFSSVRDAMLRYTRTLIVHLMETVVCHGLHSAEQRICSWLLHADDRMLGRVFPLTQEALSRVLGLRRATVSEVYSDLARAGLISYSRGLVSIVDKRGLRRRACPCYDRTIAASRAGEGGQGEQRMGSGKG